MINAKNWKEKLPNGNNIPSKAIHQVWKMWVFQDKDKLRDVKWLAGLQKHVNTQNSVAEQECKMQTIQKSIKLQKEKNKGSTKDNTTRKKPPNNSHQKFLEKLKIVFDISEILWNILTLHALEVPEGTIQWTYSKKTSPIWRKTQTSKNRKHRTPNRHN